MAFELVLWLRLVWICELVVQASGCIWGSLFICSRIVLRHSKIFLRVRSLVLEPFAIYSKCYFAVEWKALVSCFWRNEDNTSEKEMPWRGTYFSFYSRQSWFKVPFSLYVSRCPLSSCKAVICSASAKTTWKAWKWLLHSMMSDD